MNGHRPPQDDSRLIEEGFPLEAVSIDSVHEKSVRHGHISTLHIWPARRPLAASRAVIAATLLPDPGDPAARAEIYRRLAGIVVSKRTKKGEEKRETVGGILHWGRESGPDLQWFRTKIREAYGGRAPRVLDPFAGGGAIPFEAMRLGCEAIASDLNPVAWFLLECTLGYPQRLNGKRWPLPKFVHERPELLTELNGTKLNRKGKKAGRRGKPSNSDWVGTTAPEALSDGDLAAQVLAWGNWVLERARADLDRFYPNVDGKPTVAYLWARTAKCKACRATLPLLKTRWLCKKDDKRVRLTMAPGEDGRDIVFTVEADVPAGRGNATQRREHDKKLGHGTMSRSGATCPFPSCGVMMTMEDLRREGQNRGFGSVMTAVIVDGSSGKEYRLPTASEVAAAEAASGQTDAVFASIPFGVPDDPLPASDALGIRVPKYGFTKWSELFTPRQLVALGVFVNHVREVRFEMKRLGYPPDLSEAVSAYLAASIDRLADYGSEMCTWHIGRETITHTFTRFALPITWDFVESVSVNESSGGYAGALGWIRRFVDHATVAASSEAEPFVELVSATKEMPTRIDAVITDPPYYDAIPYSDLMDFFYVWLRRILSDLSPEFTRVLMAA